MNTADMNDGMAYTPLSPNSCSSIHPPLKGLACWLIGWRRGRVHPHGCTLPPSILSVDWCWGWCSLHFQHWRWIGWCLALAPASWWVYSAGRYRILEWHLATPRRMRIIWARDKLCIRHCLCGSMRMGGSIHSRTATPSLPLCFWGCRFRWSLFSQILSIGCIRWCQNGHCTYRTATNKASICHSTSSGPHHTPGIQIVGCTRTSSILWSVDWWPLLGTHLCLPGSS